MSATSGADKNREQLATLAGLTPTQAYLLTGADLMRAALRAKSGLTAAQIAQMDGARLTQAAGAINMAGQ